MDAARYMDYDYIFKILLIGDSSVGKSCLLLRYADNTYSETFITTIGVDFKIRTINMDGKNIKLQIWDTAGQERFKNIVTSYYRGADGIFVVYDMTDGATFDHVKMWLREISLNSRFDVSTVLVANKSDLTARRVVPYTTGKEYAESLRLPFIETSAKEATNVSEAFFMMAREITERFGDTIPPQNQNLSLQQSTPVQKATNTCNC